MSGYQTSSDPEVPHILDAPPANVQASEPADTTAEKARIEIMPVVGDHSDYTYNPVSDPTDHEMPTDDLHRMEVPRHDRYASENSGVGAERVVPYTATMANPSYDDGGPGIGEPAAYAPGREKDLISEADAPIQVGDQVGDIRESEKVQVEKGEAPPPEDLAKAPAPLATDVEDEVEKEDVAASADVGYEDSGGMVSAVALDPEPTPTDVSTDPVDTTVGTPAGNATAVEWRAYAVSQGMASDVADTWSRDELRDYHLYGEEPGGNASTEDWRAYAIRRGATEEEVAGMGRAELREQYGA